MLEIGTGSGAIGTSMAEIGWEVCGIDVNPLAIASARGNHQNIGIFETMEMSIEEIDEDNNQGTQYFKVIRAKSSAPSFFAGFFALISAYFSECLIYRYVNHKKGPIMNSINNMT